MKKNYDIEGFEINLFDLHLKMNIQDCGISIVSSYKSRSNFLNILKKEKQLSTD